jgi:hypothetical protein
MLYPPYLLVSNSTPRGSSNPYLPDWERINAMTKRCVPALSRLYNESFDVKLNTHSSSLIGSQEALQSLLRTDALQALLYAISNFQPTDSTTLKAAFARALRALTVAISETVGPSQWGLRPDTSDVQYEAKAAQSYLFQVRTRIII